MRGRKRLRKKLYVREFQEFGFRVGVSFREDVGEDRWRALLDDFILCACKANGLMFAGAGNANRWEGFLVLDAPRGSATEEHRTQVTSWFQGKPEVAEFQVGPLIDAWYGE